MKRAGQQPSSGFVLAGMLFFGLLAGCSSHEIDRIVGKAAPPAEHQLAVIPRQASPTDTIQLEARGLVPNSFVHIGFGPSMTRYELVHTARADARGRLQEPLAVPASAEWGVEHVVVLHGLWQAEPIGTAPLLVAPSGTAITVTGEVTYFGQYCFGLRSASGMEYSLLLPVMAEFENGAALELTGKVAGFATCGGAPSIEVIQLARIR